MHPSHFLSIDLGATSGRSILAMYDGTYITMRELTRFETVRIYEKGHVYWDLNHLYHELLAALRKVKSEGITPMSIGIDTWGCDVAFFRGGKPVGQPFCYRDPHTDGAMERYFAQCMSREELYGRTGIQFMPFNTLFQLHTILGAKAGGGVPVSGGSTAGGPMVCGRRRVGEMDKVLFMPDALIYMLTGETVMERTVASTSQMASPKSGDLDPEILKTTGLRREHFGRLVEPGCQVGVLSTHVQEQTGLGPVPVVSVASHDTASAVAAIPAEDADFAFLSCGTWSLLGVESPVPVIDDKSFRHNFTNEGGLDGTVRLLKNITGLWLLEGCRKEWTEEEAPAGINELSALCLKSSCQSLVNPDDPLFAHPDSMTAAIRDYLARTGQAQPQSPADYVRIIFRSLAARYRETVDVLRTLSPVKIRRLHVIGGGSSNKYLMQFTADALQMPVVCGPQEATALGNALVQVRAAGLVGSLQEMRAIVRRSVELHTYT